MPKGQHGVDIMRVREWYLSGHAKQHRQTILLSSFATAEANALFNRMCINYAGKARLKLANQVSLAATNLQLMYAWIVMSVKPHAGVTNLLVLRLWDCFETWLQELSPMQPCLECKLAPQPGLISSCTACSLFSYKSRLWMQLDYAAMKRCLMLRISLHTSTICLVRWL